LCGGESTAERLGLDVVGESALAVDLDHRDPFAVPRLEAGLAVDLNPLEVEAELLRQGRKLRLRPLAEVTARGLVEDDSRDKAPA
jgi:hypothetical protein